MPPTSLGGYWENCNWWRIHTGIFRRRHSRQSKYFQFWEKRICNISPAVLKLLTPWFDIAQTNRNKLKVSCITPPCATCRLIVWISFCYLHNEILNKRNFWAQRFIFPHGFKEFRPCSAGSVSRHMLRQNIVAMRQCGRVIYITSGQEAEGEEGWGD